MAEENAQQAIGEMVKARPRAQDGRELISVRGLLEWAFGTECASLDYDELGAVAGNEGCTLSQTAVVLELMKLATEPGECVRIDTSRGRSYPHDDAETVATILRNAVPFHLAVRVAELARAGRVPDWGQDARPRCRPLEWRQCKHGNFARTERVGVVRYSLAGRVRQMESRVCPVTYTDTPAEIAARQRAYLDWWGALLSVAAGLRGVDLLRFKLTDRMPPMTPWREAHKKTS